MSLFFISMILRFSGPKCTSRAYRSAEIRAIFRQAGVAMFLSCACEVGRCQNFTMKKSRCRAQRSTWRQSQKPNERRLPVRGQSAPRVTSSVRAVWPFFDWRQTANIVLAAPQSSCDIFTTCVTPVIIRGDRCGNRHHNKPVFVASREQALCETTRHFLLEDRSRKWKGTSRCV